MASRTYNEKYWIKNKILFARLQNVSQMLCTDLS